MDWRGVIGAVCAVVAGTGCGGDDGGAGELVDAAVDAASPGDAPDASAVPGFTITTPEMTVPALQERVVCFYFRSANTAPLAVRSIRSRMHPAVVDAHLSIAQRDIFPPGTLNDMTPCSVMPIEVVDLAGRWVYSTYTAEESIDFPADDGAGTPVAMVIPPDQPMIIMMHVLNLEQVPVNPSVDIELVGHEPGTVVTPVHTFISWEADLAIPSLGTDESVRTCDTPAGAAFLGMTVHSHKQSVLTLVRDGATELFRSTDFAVPGMTQFASPPFHVFSAGAMTVECDYVNPNNYVINSGRSVATNEQCLGLAYFIGGTASVFCHNGFELPYTF